ncbi:hypothetical protein [Dictyobacter arantiisoli]|uniref:Uncharacterized protein n=1 Tax=Dictyobacter arantiisoli TaxID=2014874 RepID=A0A5A5T710_9CHLR|nr:hypothetical protein [Dictyobacter arantiisoli]GCF06793.1 hypothetical protein KDI_03570 [Dictyobacter arantiisoli]
MTQVLNEVGGKFGSLGELDVNDSNALPVEHKLTLELRKIQRLKAKLEAKTSDYLDKASAVQVQVFRAMNSDQLAFDTHLASLDLEQFVAQATRTGEAIGTPLNVISKALTKAAVDLLTTWPSALGNKKLIELFPTITNHITVTV